MPTPKSIGAYSTHLYAIVESVLTMGSPVEINCDDEKAAKRTRLQIYGLKHALINQPSHPLSVGAEKLTTTLDGKILRVLHVDHATPEGVKRASEI